MGAAVDAGSRATSLIPLATAARTALIALVVFGLSLWPSLGLSQAYGAFFRAQASVLCATKSEQHTITITENRVATLRGDSAVEVRWRGSREYRTSAFKTMFGFLPTALLVALVIATPVTIRRRVRLLWMGFVCVDLYVLCGTALVVLKAWYVHVPACSQVHRGWMYSAWFQGAVEKLDAIAFQEPSVNLLVPVVIWLTLCARRSVV